MEESYLTFMRNCILGGDTYGAFRGDRIQEGTLFNISFQSYKSKLGLTDRNMQVRFCFKVVLES